MTTIVNLVKTEPAIVVGFVDALIVLAITFGVPINEDQKAAIDGLLAAGLAVVAGIAIRSQVSPTASLPASAPPVVPPAPTV
jgi:hypothetical protein